MLHHLPADEKVTALREIRRVLRPGGTLELLDFGGAGPRPRGIIARLFHAGHVHDNFGGRIAWLMTEAGLADAREIDHRRIVFGDVAFYRATA